MPMQFPADLLKLLMQIGFIASGTGYYREAETIFSGIQAMSPQSEFPSIGKAVNKLNEMDPESAIQILTSEALEINPESDLAKAFLAQAFRQAGLNDRGQTLCNDILNTTEDVFAGRIAEAILIEMNPKHFTAPAFRSNLFTSLQQEGEASCR
ncbi:tetratricopeptide repeat protein [Desulfatiglans anilini]|uniref:tetratricopeptide repeat protein n=1 Tax=Desulfatiglans anilini TaxID=90728 RepID=UPI000408725E|nr:tetratricopeptide repeat protein [Desulfatiglans anilini]